MIELERRSIPDRREEPRVPEGGRRETDEVKPGITPAKFPERDWSPTRCRSCGKHLCFVTRDALRPRQMVEIRCPRCKETNYLVGLDDGTGIGV